MQFRYTDSVIGVHWKDSKDLMVLGANVASNDGRTIVKRRRKEDGSQMDVTAPHLMKDYNRNMGGVDRADQMLSLYQVDRKGHRYYLRIFLDVIEMLLHNAFVCFKQNTAHKKTPYLKFKTAVARALMDFGQIAPPSLPQTQHVPSVMHIPTLSLKKARCAECRKVMSSQLCHQSKFFCSTCNVNLCLNDKRNCFMSYCSEIKD